MLNRELIEKLIKEFFEEDPYVSQEKLYKTVEFAYLKGYKDASIFFNEREVDEFGF